MCACALSLSLSPSQTSLVRKYIRNAALSEKQGDPVEAKRQLSFARGLLDEVPAITGQRPLIASQQVRKDCAGRLQ